MRNSTENKIFNCPRLGANATLTLTYLHHDNDFKVISKMECDSDKQCDIGSPDNSGGYSWNRDLCPAMDEFKNK